MKIVYLLPLLLALLTGCTDVKPWQKELLAQRTMAFDPDPLEAQVRRHVYQSREGSGGGYSAATASCGCYFTETAAPPDSALFCKKGTLDSYHPDSFQSRVWLGLGVGQ